MERGKNADWEGRPPRFRAPDIVVAEELRLLRSMVSLREVPQCALGVRGTKLYAVIPGWPVREGERGA